MQACGVDIALPGVLPVLNKGRRRGRPSASAWRSAPGGQNIFARKNYFTRISPGLPDQPVRTARWSAATSTCWCPDGKGGAYEKRVNHPRPPRKKTPARASTNFHGMTGIDLNRAGTAARIVSEPDMRSSAEAVAYAKALHALVRWIDICDGNMQEGSFRCDA